MVRNRHGRYRVEEARIGVEFGARRDRERHVQPRARPAVAATALAAVVHRRCLGDFTRAFADSVTKEQLLGL